MWEPFQVLTKISSPSPERAVTFKDVVKLSRAGIGEVVLIEMGDIACPITPAQLKALKGAGASDQVLLALLHNERSADDDRPAVERRTRRLENTSIDRVAQKGARSVRATDHVQRAGAVLVSTRPASAEAGARAMEPVRLRGK